MALHFQLKVNSEVIGQFSARRLTEAIPEDGICTYDVRIDEYRTTVVHNYHHGAWVLVFKALDVMMEDESWRQRLI